MPIEIRELIIKAEVKSDSGTRGRDLTGNKDINRVKQEIIEESVEKALEIIKNKNER